MESIFDKSERPVLIICDDLIEYVNQAFLKVLGITDITKVLNERFLKFVSQDDWGFIAENIGEVLGISGMQAAEVVFTDLSADEQAEIDALDDFDFDGI